MTTIVPNVNLKNAIKNQFIIIKNKNDKLIIDTMLHDKKINQFIFEIFFKKYNWKSSCKNKRFC